MKSRLSNCPNEVDHMFVEEDVVVIVVEQVRKIGMVHDLV